MIGFIAPLLLGVSVGIVAISLVIVTKEVVTRSLIRSKMKKELEVKGIVATALKVKVKEKSNNAVPLEILDELENPVAEGIIAGTAVATNIECGDVISLTDTW